MHRRYSLIFFALIAALMVLRELYGAPHSPNVWEFSGGENSWFSACAGMTLGF